MRSSSRNIPSALPVTEGDQAGVGSAFGTNGAEQAPGTGHDGGAGRAGSNGAQPRPAGASPTSRRGLKNWRVRSRLLLLITIPTLTAVALGAIRIASSVQSAGAYQRVLQLANLNSDITVLAQRLEDERDQAVYYIALPSGGRAAYLAGGTGKAAPALDVVHTFQQQADQAVRVVRSELAQVGGGFQAQTQQQAEAALFALDGLAPLRLAATNTHLPALVVVQKYTDLIDNLLVLEDATALGASDPTLAQNVRVLGLVLHAQEDASQQRAILTGALLQRAFGPNEINALQGAVLDEQANLKSFHQTATSAR